MATDRGGEMNVQGLREALDELLTKRLDLPGRGTIYVPGRSIDLSDVVQTFFDQEESAELAESTPYEVVQEIDSVTLRGLLHFDWTFEGPPAWDDWIEIFEPIGSRGYVMVHPDEEMNHPWWDLLAAVEPATSRSAYEWLLAEIWGARQSTFGAELELTGESGFLKSLPTGIVILAPDLTSIGAVRAAIACWLGDDPTSEKWGELLERVGRAVRYRGAAGKTREMRDAIAEMERQSERLRSESLNAIVQDMKARSAAERADGISRRLRLLGSAEDRNRLLDMYMELTCRTK
jgi:hypothetical protein